VPKPIKRWLSLKVTRKTASKYLEELIRIGLLTKHKFGKDNYYFNNALYDLLLNVSKK
jgi:predicted transcriptional regulator